MNDLNKKIKDIRTREYIWPQPHLIIKDWEHAGLRCVLLHGSRFGNGPNGYVRVSPGHPYENDDYDDVPVEVWGGLTFRCLDSEGYTWFGWDDAHANAFMGSHQEETEGLATQLSELHDLSVSPEANGR